MIGGAARIAGETPTQAANRIGSKRTAEMIVDYYVDDVKDFELAEFWRRVVRILADREIPNEDAKPHKSKPLEPGDRVKIGKAEYRGEAGRVLGIGQGGRLVTVRLDSGSIVNFPPIDLWDE